VAGQQLNMTRDGLEAPIATAPKKKFFKKDGAKKPHRKG